jgi:hypothetical protein
VDAPLRRFELLADRFTLLVPVSVAVRTEGNRAIFTNDQGSWHVWLRWTRNPQTGAVVGPGHIGRVRAADGTLIVEDFVSPDYNLNNCQNGGLGSFGCHLGRANEHFPDGQVWNYTWNLTSRQDPARDYNFGICRARLFDGPRVDEQGIGRVEIETGLCDMVSFPEPLFLTRHTYAVYPTRVEQKIDVAAAWDGTGPPVFVKEPKLTCHSIGPRGGPRYRYLTVYSRSGGKLFPQNEPRFDIWTLPDCTRKTQQLGHMQRCRLRFEDESQGHVLNVVMMGLDANDVRSPWRGGPGMDKWAADANGLPRFVATCNGAYCLQGPQDAAGNKTLTRNWELGRFASDGRNSPPHPAAPAVGVGFHAWEGGAGYMDCLCASRAMPPLGTTYRSWACYSLGDGFIT